MLDFVTTNPFCIPPSPFFYLDSVFIFRILGDIDFWECSILKVICDTNVCEFSKISVAKIKCRKSSFHINLHFRGLDQEL